VWSIGCLIYQLLHGKPLYDCPDLKDPMWKDPKQVVNNILKQHKDIDLNDEIDESLSEENVRLIKMCLKPISFQRFSFAKLFEDRK